mgnify:CR=1 FL=1
MSYDSAQSIYAVRRRLQICSDVVVNQHIEAFLNGNEDLCDKHRKEDCGDTVERKEKPAGTSSMVVAYANGRCYSCFVGHPFVWCPSGEDLLALETFPRIWDHCDLSVRLYVNK